VAIMDGVTAFTLERPGYAALAIALAFVFNLLLQAAGWLVFRRLGTLTALTAGMVSGNCNMGLVLVALSGHASIEVTAFFALAQLPIYMLPMLLEPLYRRWRDPARATLPR
jgi:BASS family bile acid:Na+ symporter